MNRQAAYATQQKTSLKLLDASIEFSNNREINKCAHQTLTSETATIKHGESAVKNSKAGSSLGIQLRDQIRAEEIFREEVRRELLLSNAKPSVAVRLWSHLNSAFILWLLSSVVLSFVTWSYAQYENEKTERQRVQNEFRALLSEAATAIGGLQDGILPFSTAVSDYHRERIRQLGDSYRILNIIDAYENGQISVTNEKDMVSLSREMRDLGARADSAFRVWVWYATGDSVDARREWIVNRLSPAPSQSSVPQSNILAIDPVGRVSRDLDEAMGNSLRDSLSDALMAQDNQIVFSTIERAITFKLLLLDHQRNVEEVSDRLSKVTSRVRSLSLSDRNDFTLYASDEGGDIDLAFDKGLLHPDIWEYFISGFDISVAFPGLFSSQWKDAFPSTEFGSTETAILTALLRYLRAVEQLNSVSAERIQQNTDSVNRLTDHFVDALARADDLSRAIDTDVRRYNEGYWTRSTSEVPWLADRLKQQVSYLNQPNVSHAGVLLEREANAVARVEALESALDTLLSSPR